MKTADKVLRSSVCVCVGLGHRCSEHKLCNELQGFVFLYLCAGYQTPPTSARSITRRSGCASHSADSFLLLLKGFFSVKSRKQAASDHFKSVQVSLVPLMTKSSIIAPRGGEGGDNTSVCDNFNHNNKHALPLIILNVSKLEVEAAAKWYGIKICIIKSSPPWDRCEGSAGTTEELMLCINYAHHKPGEINTQSS